MQKYKRALKKSASGYSLVEIMVAAALIGMVVIVGINLYSDYQQDQVGEARGKQLGSGLELLEKFARKYQPQLTAGQAVSGVANSSSPTTAELRSLGYAPANFGDASQPGGPIIFLIAREPAGCAAAKCILSLKAVTSGSVLTKGAADSTLALKIAGNVPNGAGWTNLVSDVTKLGKNGITIPNPLGGVPAIVAAASWLGNNQASATTPPVSYNYQSISCGAGYSGVHNQQQSITTDKWGNTTTGSWVDYSNSCELLPPTPTASYTNSSPASCPSGYTGSIMNEQTCTIWSYGPTTCSNWTQTVNTCTAPPPPTCSNGASDYPTCTPPYVPPAPTCANGASDYPTCTPATAPTTPTCANGMSDYPTCTLPPVFNPPTPPVCPEYRKFCEADWANSPPMSDRPGMWYEYGNYGYEGPQCTEVRWVFGSWWDGCPDGY